MQLAVDNFSQELPKYFLIFTTLKSDMKLICCSIAVTKIFNPLIVESTLLDF